MKGKKARRKVEERLDELYTKLPDINCKGFCHVACGPISMTHAEFRRLTEASGREPTIDAEKLSCTYLKEGKCTVYSVRPLICRIFGVAEDLQCPWGCKPTRFLTRNEVRLILRQSFKIDGRKSPIASGRVDPKQLAYDVARTIIEQRDLKKNED